jgi:Emfourin
VSSRFHGVSTPLLLAGAAIVAIVIGAAAAFAIGSDDDSPTPAEATTTPTVPAATATPTSVPPSPTASPQPATPVPPTATVAVRETWSIEFQRTGGFAGLAQSLTIHSDGQATYEDMRNDRVETAALGASDLDELRALIDSTGFFSQPTPQEAPCADCFNLSITVTVAGQTHTVEAVDIGLEASLQPLVARLAALLQDGLAQ